MAIPFRSNIEVFGSADVHGNVNLQGTYTSVTSTKDTGETVQFNHDGLNWSGPGDLEAQILYNAYDGTGELYYRATNGHWFDAGDGAIRLGMAPDQPIALFGESGTIQRVQTDDLKQVLIDLGLYEDDWAYTPLNLGFGAELTAGNINAGGEIRAYDGVHFYDTFPDDFGEISYTSNTYTFHGIGATADIVCEEITATAITNNISTQKVEVAEAASLVGTRKRINFVDGSGATLSVADNMANDRVDVTVDCTVTASNIGTAGVGIFKQKNGADFEFKKINTASSAYLTITDDTGNNEVDISLTTATAGTASTLAARDSSGYLTAGRFIFAATSGRLQGSSASQYINFDWSWAYGVTLTAGNTSAGIILIGSGSSLAISEQSPIVFNGYSSVNIMGPQQSGYRWLNINTQVNSTGNGTTGYITVCGDGANANRRIGAYVTNPTFRIYAGGTSNAADWIQFYHNQTDGIIDVGRGVLKVYNAGTLGALSAGSITATAITDNISIQKVEVAKAGTLWGTRKRINFIDGTGISVTVADNSGSDRVDVTVDSHDPLTIGTANGLSLSSQALSLAAATNTTPGAATATQIKALEQYVMPYGGPFSGIKGGTYVTETMTSGSGSTTTTIYTCPSDTKGMISSLNFYNSAGSSRTVEVFWRRSGTDRALDNSQNLNAGDRQNFGGWFLPLLRAGDTIKITCTDADVYATIVIQEIPATAPIEDYLATSISTSATFISCPSNKRIVLLENQYRFNSFNGQIIIYNATGSTIDMNFYRVPSGQSVHNRYLYDRRTSFNNNQNQNVNRAIVLSASDSVAYDSTVGGGGYLYAIGIEMDNP